MGKDLKGKELGKGISQRTDGYYVARFTAHTGKRLQKVCQNLADCKDWLLESQYQDSHNNLQNPDNLTVDAWYLHWIAVKEQTVRSNTVRNYRERYIANIKPEIGHCLLQDVRPVMCQEVLNKMASEYRSKTIGQTRTTMENMFGYAVDNDLLTKNPAAKLVADIGKDSKPPRVLTREEQRTFLSVIIGHRFELAYRFALQTGLRCGELTGLRWSDIEDGKIHVQRTMEHRHGEWRTGKPKSAKGNRRIKLTPEALRILEEQKRRNSELKVVPLEWRDYIFLDADGCPVKAGTYDTALSNVCKRNGIEHFSMHTLRHTFATRCIESGMQPKTLQIIMGHAKISITMNLYVHCTDEQMENEMDMIADALLAG